jgi:hypothetical protein
VDGGQKKWLDKDKKSEYGRTERLSGCRTKTVSGWRKKERVDGGQKE